jgi:hypothetical protein
MMRLRIAQKVDIRTVVRLGADENTLLADITVRWHPSVTAPLAVNPTSVPLSTVCRRGDSQQPAPLCTKFDGHANSGCTNRSTWISRSPLSKGQSRRPITAAVATTVSNAAAKCSAHGLEDGRETHRRSSGVHAGRSLCDKPGFVRIAGWLRHPASGCNLAQHSTALASSVS